MLPVQLGGLKGCVGRIRQVRDDGDWSQDTASAGESRPDSSDSSEWSNPDWAQDRDGQQGELWCG